MNLEPNSFRLPVKLSRNLKLYTRKYRKLVRTKVRVCIYALDHFMSQHDTPEKLQAFIEEYERKRD